MRAIRKRRRIEDAADDRDLAAAEQWREQLEAVIRDSARRQRLAAAGRETVAASYTIERVAPLLIEGLTDATA